VNQNALVAQSGGPSPVINASLQGVIEGCRAFPGKIGTLYGGWHGIEGVLLEELIDLSSQPRKEISLLSRTPAAGAIGTCRYKLPDDRREDYDRILDVFRAHRIGYFFYIGGNDSMDTAQKVSDLAKQRGLDLIVTGVPKTIDNDLGDEAFSLIDHTPGYGSAARYWALHVQNTDEENRGMCGSEPVSVLQAMGRGAGYIAAAARLADPERRMPLQIYLPESGHTLRSLEENVAREVRRSGRCIVVVNESFGLDEAGNLKDAFGHVEYGAGNATAAQIVVNHLNSVKLPARGNVTGQVPGVFQRSTSIFASAVDLDEAYEVGKKAVEVAVAHGSGWMATILRKKGATSYSACYDKVPLYQVANSARRLPKTGIAANGLDVTDDFLRYARPLIGDKWPEISLENGLQRFARIERKFVGKKLRAYTPVGFRTKAG